MRLAHLNLVRYGKFTDKEIALPQSPQDFHFVVGPNEAGKSTFRNAVQDLLYGIELRSPFNFLHDYKDMQLAGLLQNGASSLEFARIKSKRSLINLDGEPLEDDALLPYIGQTDRRFFEKMFGLNHERIVSGGQAILDSSDDIGQMLFQAAAGIGGFAEARDRLEEEASKIWGKRRSGDKEYYIAQAALEQADAKLKQCTVRARDWQEAYNKVEMLSQQKQQTAQRWRAIEGERVRMERVRRVAGMLTTLSRLEVELAELGDVILLPQSAAVDLQNAEQKIAIASSSLATQQAQLQNLEQQFAAYTPNEQLLQRAEEIEALNAMRQQYRSHAGDIQKRQEEARNLLLQIISAAQDLGWRELSEAEIAARLPGKLLRSRVADLASKFEALQQNLNTLQASLQERTQELLDIKASLGKHQVSSIPAALEAAVKQVRSLGDVDERRSNLMGQIANARNALETLQPQLGEWNLELAALRALVPPSQDEINTYLATYRETQTSISKHKDRIAELQEKLGDLNLEINQYRQANQPVTLDDLHAARNARDSLWTGIKTGQQPLLDGAHSFEEAIVTADRLSDLRHDKAREATELQTKLDEKDRLELQLASQQTSLAEQETNQTDLMEEWSRLVTACGLPGMPLLKIQAWLQAHANYLAALPRVEEAERQLENLNDRAKANLDGLKKVLVAFKPEAAQMDGEALVMLSEKEIAQAQSSKGQLEALEQSAARTSGSLGQLKTKNEEASQAMQAWRRQLDALLEQCHMALDLDPDTVQTALELFASMESQLEKIQDIRTNRIQTMQHDLDRLKEEALGLARDLMPSLLKETPEIIVLKLAELLASETMAADEKSRVGLALDKARENVQQEQNRLQETQAGLQQLMALASVQDNEALRHAIQRSDKALGLQNDIGNFKQAVETAGDGLSREALEDELKTTDVSGITAHLSELQMEAGNLLEEQNRLVTEYTTATQALERIGGQNEAAQAESQRQEAMAQMGAALERYLKVLTAAKLLKWAMDRFRESKQGPMLSRASEIFAGLTNGAFCKLHVDYEEDPAQLFGQRASGGYVSVPGMSEGTRDQLFMALRLAALELHLSQATPMPFIADDLFINYDDKRSKAGFEAMAKLSEKTQVIFLSHHDHLVDVAQKVFGNKLNVVRLS